MNEDEFNEVISRYRYNASHDADRIKRLEESLLEEKNKHRDIDAIILNLDVEVAELKKMVRLLEAAGDEIVASTSFHRMAKTMAAWQNLRKLSNNEQPNE